MERSEINSKITLKPFGDHPFDKYLLVVLNGKQILAKQSTGNDYFETILGWKVKVSEMEGWIDEATKEDIEMNKALLDIIYALQMNHDDETVH